MKIAVILVLLSTSVFSSEYIVKLKPHVKLSKNLRSFGEFAELKLSYGNFYVLKSENKNSIKELTQNPNVEYIEPNFQYKTFSQVGDTKFSKQWGLENTGKNSGSIFSRGVPGRDISAVKAWSITKGSKEIKIAVIDTGVDYTHKDLADNILINEAELNGAPGVDDDGNGYVDDIRGYDFANNDNDPKDGHGHGTHCAGVIGAVHNDIGIAGVMAQVKILPIKFLKNDGSGSLASALQAIDYARIMGVNIMSNSWGGGGRSQSLFEAIERATDAGILFVAAAGNSNLNNDKKPTYPANYKTESLFSVGAMDHRGRRANFSNYGKKTVHIFAPGVEILSTVKGNKYEEMSGTSMAAPHVAGVAGLIWANEPNLTLSEIKTRMMDTALRSKELNIRTLSGYIDAYRALTNTVD